MNVKIYFDTPSFFMPKTNHLHSITCIVPFDVRMKIQHIILSDKESILYLQLRNDRFGNGHFGTKIKAYEIF